MWRVNFFQIPILFILIYTDIFLTMCLHNKLLDNMGLPHIYIYITNKIERCKCSRISAFHFILLFYLHIMQLLNLLISHCIRLIYYYFTKKD